jgi:hypothetical protein
MISKVPKKGESAAKTPDDEAREIKKIIADIEKLIKDSPNEEGWQYPIANGLFPDPDDVSKAVAQAVVSSFNESQQDYQATLDGTDFGGELAIVISRIDASRR